MKQPISEVFNGDCMEYMAGLPDKFFNLIIADPPYGIGASGTFGHYWNSTNGKSATKGIRNQKKEWDYATPDLEYFKELFRVSLNQIIWGANYFTDKLPISRGWICYDKKQPETNSFGKFELAWTSFDAIAMKFEYYPTHVTQGQRIHPTQKPVDLYKWLLKNYAKPGDKIFDPMMGSQSSRIAAWDMGFDFWGCELDTDYFRQGCARFEKHIASKTSLFEPEEMYFEQAKLF